MGPQFSSSFLNLCCANNHLNLFQAYITTTAGASPSLSSDFHSLTNRNTLTLLVSWDLRLRNPHRQQTYPDSTVLERPCTENKIHANSDRTPNSRPCLAFNVSSSSASVTLEDTGAPTTPPVISSSSRSRRGCNSNPRSPRRSGARRIPEAPMASSTRSYKVLR